MRRGKLTLREAACGIILTGVVAVSKKNRTAVSTIISSRSGHFFHPNSSHAGYTFI